MNNTPGLLLVALSLLLSLRATAQISGRVTDATSGDPLIAASVLVRGTTIGTVTDVAYDPAAGANTDRIDQLYLSHTGGGGAVAWTKTNQREPFGPLATRDGTGHQTLTFNLTAPISR